MKIKSEKRIQAGKAGIGVPRKFSDEEIAKRTARLMAVRHLGPQAMIRKASSDSEKRKEHAAYVKAQAALGVFVPVEDFE